LCGPPTIISDLPTNPSSSGVLYPLSISATCWVLREVVPSKLGDARSRYSPYGYPPTVCPSLYSLFKFIILRFRQPADDVSILKDNGRDFSVALDEGDAVGDSVVKTF
jgi:hypothetical protein